MATLIPSCVWCACGQSPLRAPLLRSYQYEVAQNGPTVITQLLSDCTFLLYNYKYDWLCPTLQEIAAAYMKLHGKESRESGDES